MIFQGHWSSLIEEDSHFDGRSVPGLDFSEALLGMREHPSDLLGRDAGKPLQELINGGAGFQVFEECSSGYASSPKNPRATYLTLDALNSLAITPIEHAQHVMLAPETTQEVLFTRSISGFGNR